MAATVSIRCTAKSLPQRLATNTKLSQAGVAPSIDASPPDAANATANDGAFDAGTGRAAEN